MPVDQLIPLSEAIEIVIPQGNYYDFTFNIGDDVTSDIVVEVNCSQPLGITLFSLVNNAAWTSPSPLIVFPTDQFRSIGLYHLNIANPNATAATATVQVFLANTSAFPTPSPNELDTFNVIYFVSFFFLFLFSFLFVAVIIKKIRDIVIFNRLRAQYLKARAHRVIPPKFVVDLLTPENALRTLTPDRPSVPVAVEFIDCEEVEPVAAVTFVFVGPLGEDEDHFPAIAFATTLFPLPRTFSFAPLPSPPPQALPPQAVPRGSPPLENVSSLSDDRGFQEMGIEDGPRQNTSEVSSFPDDLAANLDRTYLQPQHQDLVNINES